MYSSVKAGLDAIKHAEKLVAADATRGKPGLSLADISEYFGHALEKAMAEGGLYDTDLAALAFKQAQGDGVEAAFLLRAYRSTLPRIGYSLPSQSSEMRILRRVSGAFQDIPGGQVLGRTRDYSLRLLDFNMSSPSPAEITIDDQVKTTDLPGAFPCIIDFLRQDGYLAPAPATPKKQDPFDVTREPLRFPAKRSARLQVLARGESGAMLSLGYAAMRGYGESHAYVSEIRGGEAPVKIKHPITGGEVQIGWVPATEAHVVFPGKASVTGSTHDLSFGYGLTVGRDERKAISMGIIDENLNHPDPNVPSLTQNEEYVLNNLDCIDASGFVEHLKMPHYVSFQADIQRTSRVVELVKAAKKNG